MVAKKLEIEVKDIGSDADSYTVTVWEFANGAILAPHEDASAEFFSCIEEYRPCGIAEVLNVEETDQFFEWEPEELALEIIKSVKEYGWDTLPIEVLSLF